MHRFFNKLVYRGVTITVKSIFSHQFGTLFRATNNYGEPYSAITYFKSPDDAVAWDKANIDKCLTDAEKPQIAGLVFVNVPFSVVNQVNTGLTGTGKPLVETAKPEKDATPLNDLLASLERVIEHYEHDEEKHFKADVDVKPVEELEKHIYHDLLNLKNLLTSFNHGEIGEVKK